MALIFGTVHPPKPIQAKSRWAHRPCSARQPFPRQRHANHGDAAQVVPISLHERVHAGFRLQYAFDGALCLLEQLVHLRDACCCSTIRPR